MCKRLSLNKGGNKHVKTTLRQSLTRLATSCLGHAYQTGAGINFPVRQGKAALRTVKESLETAKMIETEVSVALGGRSPHDLAEFTVAVFGRLQYHIPVILDQELGAPPHSLATINAHIKKQQGLG